MQQIRHDIVPFKTATYSLYLLFLSSCRSEGGLILILPQIFQSNGETGCIWINSVRSMYGANKRIRAICGVYDTRMLPLPDAKSQIQVFLNIVGYTVFHASNSAVETFSKTR